jgi:hypothetical protein
MKSRFEEDMVKPNGDLLSTYNPNAKWDYYTIGGAWDKCLHTDKTQVNKAFTKKLIGKDAYLLRLLHLLENGMKTTKRAGGLKKEKETGK